MKRTAVIFDNCCSCYLNDPNWQRILRTMRDGFQTGRRMLRFLPSCIASKLKAVLALEPFKDFKKNRTYGSVPDDVNHARQAIRSCGKWKISTVDRFALSKETASVFLKEIAGGVIGVVRAFPVILQILRLERFRGHMEFRSTFRDVFIFKGSTKLLAAVPA